MPDPDRLLNTLRLATEAVRATPGRRGHRIDLQATPDVFVAGDLHGNVENLRLILERAQLAKNPGRHLVLQELIHGPHRYPAGGDKSHQLVDLFAALKCQFPRQVHFLLGNHELSQWTARAIGKGDVDFNAIFREGIGAAYGPHAAAVYEAYFKLFEVLPVAICTANRVLLSHFLPFASKRDAVTLEALERDDWEPADLLPGGAAHAIVWGRDTTLENITAYLGILDADLLISGHIPCPVGFATPNEKQIILDAMGSPACCCLFPADRVVSYAELVAGILTL
jgi:Calcineurin-like phosphoesterase